MNWFGGLIANIINLIANGINVLVSAVTKTGLAHTAMGNVIMNGFFPFETDSGTPALDAAGNPIFAFSYPGWGAGNFSDVMDPKAVDSLQMFSYSFWALGWTFFAISLYLLAIQVSGAAESSIQRDRLKKGVLSVFVSVVLIWQGPHLAILVTQIFFYLSDYFINLNQIQNWTPLSDSGDQALLNSIVNLLQAILSIIVWIVYQFRLVFLYVWMVFFPLAMAFYANDKTRGLAKMWWTEWIYQMALPFGQAVVYGIASAVASPGKSGDALTAADIFVALAGTIGLLGSAVYIRKMVEKVAEGFGASMIGGAVGAMGWGNLGMVGGGALTGDLLGKAGLKAVKGTAGKGLGKAFKKLDNSNWMRSKAEKAVGKYGEVHAGSIKSGASMDDILMNQKLGASGDVLQNGGVGLEAAGTSGLKSFGTKGSSGSSTRRSSYRHPLSTLKSSQTVGAASSMASGFKSAISKSNMATWLGTARKGKQNDGGRLGQFGDKIAPKIAAAVSSSLGQKALGKTGSGAVAHGAHKYMANRANHAARLQDLRSHLKETMENNALAARVPSISSLYDPQNNTFQGFITSAEKKYNAASQQFVSALQAGGLSQETATKRLQQAQQHWDRGMHLPNLQNYSPDAQTAYRQAFSAYRPAQLDSKAKSAVIAGKIVATPPVNMHRNSKEMTNAFLNDARNAVMNRR